MHSSQRDYFHFFGFVILPEFFDPQPLSSELDIALREGATADFGEQGVARGRFAPMMSEHTPHSLALLHSLAPLAADLLRRDALPTRAKGVLYHRETSWHTDSTGEPPSIGAAAYLEELSSKNGALNVVPGSHRAPTSTKMQEALAAKQELPGYPVETNPGDVILFDEKIFHASKGGSNRRQWRVDFTIDPKTPEEHAAVTRYYQSIFQDAARKSYNAEKYPSYSAHWKSSTQPFIDRLAQLGVYQMAEASEQR